MAVIFHIIEKENWNCLRSDELYEPESIENEGFIHCSMRSEIVSVAHRFFRGRNDLVLLCIDPALVRAEIRYERAGDGAPGLFPHIYGPLNLDAVAKAVDFPCRPDGIFELPNELMGEAAR